MVLPDDPAFRFVNIRGPERSEGSCSLRRSRRRRSLPGHRWTFLFFPLFPIVAVVETVAMRAGCRNLPEQFGRMRRGDHLSVLPFRSALVFHFLAFLAELPVAEP